MDVTVSERLEKAACMNSSGLRVLPGRLRAPKEADGEMAFCSLRPGVSRVFPPAGEMEGWASP